MRPSILSYRFARAAVGLFAIFLLARAASAAAELPGAPCDAAAATPYVGADDPIRVGMIGLDTSHSPGFTKVINDPEGEGLIARYEVVAAYPYGSTEIASSYERIPRYTEEVREMGVEIVDSIDELLARVDVVLLVTNDGNPRLEQARQVIEAGKPIFIDKPVAAHLSDVVEIYELAEDAGVPVFSTSSLRYIQSAQAIRGGSIGEVRGAMAYSPAVLEPSHTDLYWYGIHGVEILFTVMGTGCETVVRTHSDAIDVVTCRWQDGRVGTFYGVRDGQRGYGGTAFGDEEIADLGPYEGQEAMLVEVLEFFETGKSPVSTAETLEIYAFMTAADLSKQRGGAPVSMDEVLREAGVNR